MVGVGGSTRALKANHALALLHTKSFPHVSEAELSYLAPKALLEG